jgi:hypothetical protein
VFSFSDQVGINPMLLAHLEVLPLEPDKFGSPEPTADQQSQDGPVALARIVSAGRVWSNFLDCSTVSQLPILTPRRLAPFTRRMPAASSGLSSPVSAASYASRRTAGQAHIDSGWSEVVLLQEESIPEHNGPAEGQSWFRAVPADEFVDRVAIRFLRTRSRQGIENRGFGLFQVREPKHCFRF